MTQITHQSQSQTLKPLKPANLELWKINRKRNNFEIWFSNLEKKMQHQQY